MDLPNQISNRIAQLRSGEKWTVSIQDLLISRADFQSLSVFLSRESEKGTFSLGDVGNIKPHFEHTSLTIIKN
ncbi:hypothetical protein [Acinetobacter wuhouensis]|uniref:Uncharacterized protein n=1 Tax=Acinetobacter wuhouensis TaxID=1879050 RepID=A0A4Q7AHP6_9GAMM|nr:hypothetical protein [Acinetobacter wuhouensis]RZG45490.1 hypothetical protein EXU28_11655 [Acinetobacter wuhouensis]